MSTEAASDIEIPDTFSERVQNLKDSGEPVMLHPNDPVLIYLFFNINLFRRTMTALITNRSRARRHGYF